MLIPSRSLDFPFGSSHYLSGKWLIDIDRESHQRENGGRFWCRCVRLYTHTTKENQQGDKPFSWLWGTREAFSRLLPRFSSHFNQKPHACHSRLLSADAIQNWRGDEHIRKEEKKKRKRKTNLFYRRRRIFFSNIIVLLFRSLYTRATLRQHVSKGGNLIVPPHSFLDSFTPLCVCVSMNEKG